RALYLTYYFLFNHPTTTQISTLSLHDALPISPRLGAERLELDRLERKAEVADAQRAHPGLERRHLEEEERPVGGLQLLPRGEHRSEEHTSELQSLRHLVCRLLLEKKKT